MRRLSVSLTSVLLSSLGMLLNASCSKPDEASKESGASTTQVPQTGTNPSPQQQGGPTPQQGTPNPAQATPKQPCVPCATQEDFDAAGKKGRSCCASHTCSGDGDCSGGRVCCKVPLGTLCTDSGRCAAGDRVKAAAPGKLAPGTCKTSNDCPNAGSDLCCDNGPGKPGKCVPAGAGIKGCNPPSP